MPPRTDESPPRQQDRADEVSGGTRDELRNFEPDPPRKDGNYDIGDLGEWMDYPDINTHGSER
jgi:hypothetical protein